MSDGISEAQSEAGEEYGEGRLAHFVAQHKEASVEELRRLVFGEIDFWSGAQERGDDQIIVILKAVTGKS